MTLLQSKIPERRSGEASDKFVLRRVIPTQSYNGYVISGYGAGGNTTTCDADKCRALKKITNP